MKLYLECNMGASGDMLMSALYELLPDKAVFREKMKELALPGVTFEYAESEKCGIKGTHIRVMVCGEEEKSEDADKQFINTNPQTAHTHINHSNNHNHNHNHNHDHEHTHSHSHSYSHDHDHVHEHTHNHACDHSNNNISSNTQHSTPLAHHHGSYDDILELIRKLDIPEEVRRNALDVYRILGEAEAAVHGVSLDTVHLHEVGSLDAVADIVGCCLLIHMLEVTDITASPVCVGSGHIRCQHGILPVPAPATAEILKGIPVYSGRIKSELCTPTGAALLKHMAKSFSEMPQMVISKIGYGMGSKDLEAANCIRAYLYNDALTENKSRTTVTEISCNLDDMTAEAIGAAFEVLLSNGALDVYTTPIMMKKNRPAVKLSCLCADEQCEKLTTLLLQHTTTLGVRFSSHERTVLKRTVQTATTAFGEIYVKRAEGPGIIKYKPEYDDVQTAAVKHNVPFQTVYDAAFDAISRHSK